jgi:hypothetical protein
MKWAFIQWIEHGTKQPSWNFAPAGFFVIGLFAGAACLNIGPEGVSNGGC